MKGRFSHKPQPPSNYDGIFYKPIYKPKGFMDYFAKNSGPMPFKYEIIICLITCAAIAWFLFEVS